MPDPSYEKGDGSIASGDLSADEKEVDIPVGVAFPDVDTSVGVPTVKVPVPCGYGVVTLPGAGFPVQLSLGALADALGLHIPIIEVPTVCPEVQEALLLAAVAALQK